MKEEQAREIILTEKEIKTLIDLIDNGMPDSQIKRNKIARIWARLKGFNT